MRKYSSQNKYKYEYESTRSIKNFILPRLFFFFFFLRHETSIRIIGFFQQKGNPRLSSDGHLNSSEERVNLSFSGSKTGSSGGRLGSFKLFLIIKKR